MVQDLEVDIPFQVALDGDQVLQEGDLLVVHFAKDSFGVVVVHEVVHHEDLHEAHYEVHVGHHAVHCGDHHEGHYVDHLEVDHCLDHGPGDLEVQVELDSSNLVAEDYFELLEVEVVVEPVEG